MFSYSIKVSFDLFSSTHFFLQKIMEQEEEKNQKENKTENVQNINKTQSNLQMFTRPFDLNKMHYDIGELHPDKEIEDTILAILKFNCPKFF